MELKLLVFGASGKTGRLIVESALSRGMQVTAFVRDPAKLAMTHEKLRVVQGDVSDAAAVDRVVPGHDVVASALGTGKPLKHDPAVIAGVGHIAAAMTRAGVRRIVYQSFIGVGQSRSAAGPMIRYVARVPLKHEIGDHETKEALLRGSTLDWTIIAAPGLKNGTRTGVYRVGTDISARSFFPMLPRADVAEFMVGEIESPKFVRQAVRLLHP